MKRIERHKVQWDEIDFAMEAFKETYDSGWSTLGKTPRNLEMHCTNARALAGYTAFRDPESEEIVTYMRVGAQASAAVFAVAAANPGEEVSVTIAGREVRYQSLGPHDGSHVMRWLEGFFMATVARDFDALAVLRQTPERIVRASGTKADECQYLYMQLLQQLRPEAEPPKLAVMLRDTLAATDPERITIDEEWVLNIVVPETKIIYGLIKRDQAEYEDALRFALERHQKFYKKASRRTDPLGFLALGPIALAAMCFEQGLPPGVESDYLPRPLVLGDQS